MLGRCGYGVACGRGQGQPPPSAALRLCIGRRSLSTSTCEYTAMGHGTCLLFRRHVHARGMSLSLTSLQQIQSRDRNTKIKAQNSGPKSSGLPCPTQSSGNIFRAPLAHHISKMRDEEMQPNGLKAVPMGAHQVRWMIPWNRVSVRLCSAVKAQQRAPCGPPEGWWLATPVGLLKGKARNIEAKGGGVCGTAIT